MSDMEDTAVALGIVSNLKSSQYCYLAVAFAIAYNHITTIDLEVELVWCKKWTVVTGLFVLNRYLLATITIGNAIVTIRAPSSQWANSCYIWYCTQGWGAAVGLWALQGILQYRIYAIYYKHRKIVIFMLACFAVEIAIMSVVLVFCTNRTIVSVEPVPGIHICTPTFIPDISYMFWIPAFCFDFFLLFLVARTGVQHLRELRLIRGLRSPSLKHILLRDSISFPFITFALYAFSLAVWKAFPPIWFTFSAPFVELICCTLASRLIFNLREAFYLPFSEEVDRSPQSGDELK